MGRTYTVTQCIDVPGARIEMRDYPAVDPLCETSVQPVYTLGLRCSGPGMRARYPDEAGSDDFHSLGSIVFRPPDLPWQVESPGTAAHVLHCAVDRDRFEDIAGCQLAREQGALLASFDIRSVFIQECLTILRRETSADGSRNPKLIDRVLDAAIVELAHQLRQRAARMETGALGNGALWRVEAGLNELWDVYPSAEDVAEILGISVRSLRERFRSTTGEPIGAYIARVQLDKAAMLLRTTALPLKQIAYRVGFAHAGNFSVAFRRRFGETPSVYRRSA